VQFEGYLASLQNPSIDFIRRTIANKQTNYKLVLPSGVAILVMGISVHAKLLYPT
jgi:hypothetical protein